MCLTNTEIESETMLLIAKELGLSETAFITQKTVDSFNIRFFSPVMEIPLYGHATLASSEVVFERNAKLKQITFTNTQGIELEINKSEDEILNPNGHHPTHLLQSK